MRAARIVFAGSPDFAVPPLQALLTSSCSVVAVLTQPDRPTGRGRKLVSGPVKAAALAAGVQVLQPPSLRAAAEIQALKDLKPDLIVVVAYGQLLPADVLAVPRVACLNIHASLLPRWRGAAPIQAALLAGDAVTGVSLMQMEQGLDTGPVYAARALDIHPHETAGELHDRLACLGAELLLDNLEAVLDDRLQARPQSESGVTWAPRIAKSDGLIDWRRSATDIDRQIRAYNPWPMAYTVYAGQSLRCLRASPGPKSDAGMTAPPGSVLGLVAGALHVQAGTGTLLLHTVQLPGRKAVDGRSFANAHATVGVALGRAEQ